MARQLLGDNEDAPTKSFTLKRVLAISGVMVLGIVVVILCTVRDRLGTEKEAFTSSQDDVTAPFSICQNADRLHTVERFCNKHKHSNNNNNNNRPWHFPARRYRHIIVDEVHRMLYCAVPGTGSSSMIDLLKHHQPSRRRFQNKPPGRRNDGLARLSDYDPDEIHKKLTDYYKFVLVRHPLVRLRSAYVHLFLSGTTGRDRYWPVVSRTQARSWSTGLSARSGRINFYQFLDLVLRNKSFRDEHWMTYSWMCLPCHIRYDAVLKLETVHEDIRIIMDQLKSADNGTNAEYDVFWNVNSLNQYDITNKVFRSVPPALMNRIRKRYQADLDLFGYVWNEEQGARCLIRTQKNRKCC